MASSVGGFYFIIFSLFSVEHTTSGISHRVKWFSRVGNQYAECEKQQQQQLYVLYCMAFKTVCYTAEQGNSVLYCMAFKTSTVRTLGIRYCNCN